MPQFGLKALPKSKCDNLRQLTVHASCMSRGTEGKVGTLNVFVEGRHSLSFFVCGPFVVQFGSADEQGRADERTSGRARTSGQARTSGHYKGSPSRPSTTTGGLPYRQCTAGSRQWRGRSPPVARSCSCADTKSSIVSTGILGRRTAPIALSPIPHPRPAWFCG